MRISFAPHFLLALGLAGSAFLFSCDKQVSPETSSKEHATETGKATPPDDGEAHEEDANRVELTPDQLQLAGITLGTVKERPIGSGLQVNGVLDSPPENVVSVTAPLGGFVKSTDLLQGTKVRKGQVLATIQNSEFIQMQQEYLEGRAQLELARTEYERQKELVAEDVTPVKTFQKAKAEYQMVQARMAGLTERLKLAGISLSKLKAGKISSEATLTSPINGYVRAVNVNLGSYVNPPDVLFEIVDPEHLHVELTVFEKDAQQLQKGQKVRFTLPNDPSLERTATVYLIGKAIGPERSVRVHAHMDKEEPDMLPGMYVKATIETGQSTVPSLPEEAFVEFEGKHYLFIFEGKENSSTAYRMIEVGKGLTQNGFSEVILPGNFDRGKAQVVLTGAFSLLSKMKNSEEEGGHAH